MDERLIDPSFATLGDAVNQAVAAANAGRKVKVPLAPSAADRAGLLDQLAKRPAGAHAFADKKAPLARVEIDWWTDPASRRHVRVRGFPFHSRSDAEDYAEFLPTDVPPLGRVYPGSLAAVSVAGKKEQTFAVCRCGAVGSPNAVAWCGLRCGPCADAEAEGRPVPPPVAVYGLGGGAVRFTPDGSGLVTDTPDGRLVRLDLRTGERTTSDPVKGGGLVDVACGPDGAVTGLFGSNTLARWDVPTNTLATGKAVLRVGTALAPDGRHLMTNLGDLYDEGPWVAVIDWSNPKRLTKPTHQWPDLKRGGWSRDGSRWVGLTRGMEFVQIDVPSGRRTVLRENVFVDTDTWNGEMLDAVDVLALDPDANRQVMAYHDGEHGWHPPAQLNVIASPDEAALMAGVFEDEEDVPSVYGFSPDGHWLLYGTAGGVQLWPATAGRMPLTVRGVGLGAMQPEHAAFSPDGGTLAVQMPDGVLWLLPLGRLLAAVPHTVARRRRSG